MSKLLVAACAAFLAVGGVAHAATLKLILQSKFTFDGAGIAYVPAATPGDDGTLYLVSDGEAGSTDGRVTRCTISGACSVAFDTGYGQLGGIAVKGDDLVVVDTVRDQAKLGVFSTAGQELQSFDVFTRTLSDGTPVGDPDAVYYDAQSDQFVVGDDQAAQLNFYSSNGVLQQSLPTTDIAGVLDEPQGLTRDPGTGNYLIANDDGGPAGTGLLFEVSQFGQLINQFALFDTDGVTRLFDPEGLAYDATNNRLFVVFDKENIVGTFTFTPSPVPLPPGVLLMGAGIAALGVMRQRRRPLRL